MSDRAAHQIRTPRQATWKATPSADAAGGPASSDLIAVEALLQVDPALDEAGTASEFADRVLGVLAAQLNATACSVRLDRADGQGTRTLAFRGKRLPERAGLQRVTLEVTRPWTGELLLAAPDTPQARVLALLAAQRLGLVLENERLREADLRRQIGLTFLAEVSELLAQSLDITLTLALIPRLVVPRLGQWCALYAADASGTLQLTAAAHADETMTPWLRSATSELSQRLLSQTTVDALRTGTYTSLPTPLDGFAVPLMARGQWLGTLAVGRSVTSDRDLDEIAIAEEVARRAALAIDNARIHDERQHASHTLQQALLPATLPKIPLLGLGAQYVPTGPEAEVGGDLYDVMAMPDGRWLLLVGDVSGKGLHAATVTGLVREVTRVLVKDGRTLDSVLSTLNETLCERSERYCTLALAVVTPPTAATRQVHVSLRLAGHDQPLLIRASGKVSPVGNWGPALGLTSQVTCPAASVVLDPGDTLLFFTDGVTDRRNGNEFFGYARLQQEAALLAGHPADVIAARLRTVTLGFSPDPPRDDIAIMAIRNDIEPLSLSRQDLQHPGDGQHA